MNVPGRTAPVETAEPLLDVRALHKRYPVRRGLFARVTSWVRAVDGVSLAIRPGETLALVGESGSGKTTLGRCVLRLIEPTSGTIRFDGADLLALPPRDLRRARRSLQVVFQDPYGSLNPRMTVGAIVREPLDIHRIGRRGAEREAMVDALFTRVGLDPAMKRRYPHAFSGGQRQRIGVARAIALKPKLIVADEPVSALDVSIQAQVINLLVDLQEADRCAYLFIAHDLAVVERFADRVAVMYLGRIVETAPARDIFTRARHPYTQALLQAIPVPDPDRTRDAKAKVVEGAAIPSPAEPPPGCRFHPRCPIAVEACRREDPPLREIAPGHFAACHLA